MGFGEDILAKHNELRQRLVDGQVPRQPRAKDIKALKYSCALEKLAQGWADFMCKNNHWDHNPNRKITSQHLRQCPGSDLDVGVYVGENLWMSGGRANLKTVVSGVDAWFNEHVDYTYVKNQSPGECTPGKMCGHYTQVIWSKTTHVGCAWKVCSGGQTYLVCNYAPGGNMGGRYPYEKADGTSAGGNSGSGKNPNKEVGSPTEAEEQEVIKVVTKKHGDLTIGTPCDEFGKEAERRGLSEEKLAELMIEEMIHLSGVEVTIEDVTCGSTHIDYFVTVPSTSEEDALLLESAETNLKAANTNSEVVIQGEPMTFTIVSNEINDVTEGGSSGNTDPLSTAGGWTTVLVEVRETEKKRQPFKKGNKTKEEEVGKERTEGKEEEKRSQHFYEKETEKGYQQRIGRREV